jgi:hypothetical protein
MYLDRHQYIGANYKHRNIQGGINLIQGKDNTPIPIDLSRLSTMIFREVYWRKANAIHNWFVHNVQEDNDDCGDYYVPPSKLRELGDICRKLADWWTDCPKVTEQYEARTEFINGNPTTTTEQYQVPADPSLVLELLPPTSGFFFGSTEITKYFFEDCEFTADEIDRILQKDPDGDFYYHSSW